MGDDEILTLQSQDGQDFKVLVKSAKMSETIKNLIDDAGTESAIPLPNVSAKILAKVVEYCNYHIEHPKPPVDDKNPPAEDDIIGWDIDFCKVDQPTLFDLILAANYLDIKDLLDLMCKTVANMIKGKTPEEIKKTFNIKDDFTPEEEEQVRKENEWCEER
jgi:S-phase kinase-associated protein 1